MAKRLFDLFICLLMLPLLIPVFAVIAVLIKVTSSGPVYHWSKRIGTDNEIFLMPKFRTMKVDAPDVATHLLKDPQLYVTSVGRFLRKTSLDELPQLYSVLVGDMSFVGPRPALFNQDDLIELRTKVGVHKVKPGITGWAQINGRDELSIPVKVQYDEYYVKNCSFLFDLKILFLTFFKVFNFDEISH